MRGSSRAFHGNERTGATRSRASVWSAAIVVTPDGAVGDRRLQGREHLVRAVEEQVLLRGEVVEDRPDGDVGRRSDLGDRHRLEAALGEQLGRDVGDRLARALLLALAQARRLLGLGHGSSLSEKLIVARKRKRLQDCGRCASMPGMSSSAIRASGLVKRYGETTALAGVDLEVPTGSVCGVLGPNGAGKTTAVRILTTLSDATSGTAEVAGFDVRSQATEVRRRIGLAAQDATVDGLLTGRENLVMIGELHHLGRSRATLPRRRTARAVHAHRRPRPPGEGVLRRHAASPGSRGHPRRPAGRALPRRADHRPGPARPQRPVGRARPARRRRLDAAADHAVPRGGRSPRRRRSW